MDIRDWFSTAQSTASDTYDRSVDRLLERMGLQYKQSAQDAVLPALGIFAAGLAVGATLGLLFAPKPGSEVRQEFRHRLEDLADEEKAAE